MKEATIRQRDYIQELVAKKDAPEWFTEELNILWRTLRSAEASRVIEHLQQMPDKRKVVFR